jgi:hypothetical protein
MAGSFGWVLAYVRHPAIAERHLIVRRRPFWQSTTAGIEASRGARLPGFDFASVLVKITS